MQNQSLQSTLSDDFFKKVCKALSVKFYEPFQFVHNPNYCGILKPMNNELVFFSANDIKWSGSCFSDITSMLKVFLAKNTHLLFNGATDHKFKRVDVSKTFGKTLDEININLDLLGA